VSESTLTTAVLALIAVGALAALTITARGGELEERDWQVIGTLAAALFCGSAALTTLRVGAPAAFAAAIPVAALALLAAEIWKQGLWDDSETDAKAILTALASTLAVLLVTSLQLQLPRGVEAVRRLHLAVSALIAVTTLYGLVLLWSWDPAFFDGRTGRNVDNAAQRVLVALVVLSVAAYLAAPFVALRIYRRGRQP
jgi:hypothetical protein